MCQAYFHVLHMSNRAVYVWGGMRSSNYSYRKNKSYFEFARIAISAAANGTTVNIIVLRALATFFRPNDGLFIQRALQGLGSNY